MRALFPIALGVSLAACAGGPAPDIATPPPALPASFYFETERVEARDVDALLPLEDPAYRRLANAALAGAPSLAEALARLDAARARAKGAAAARRPELGLGADITATRTNPAQFGSNNPFANQIDTEQVAYGASLAASWDADLFGQLRARERAALAQVDAASASAAAVRIAMLAEIAGAVIDWRTLDSRIAAVESDLAAATQLAGLARVREDAGLAPGFDRVRAEAQASAARARRAALEGERAQVIGRLVTLTALDAAEIATALAQDGRPPMPDAVPQALPSDLLANRPGIAAAAGELAASDAELAAAARARFPQLTLSSALGLLAFNPADLFDEDALVGSLAANVAAPLVAFGRIEAQIEGAAANKRAAYQAYRAAVYRALGEAEAAYGLVEAADREAELARAERDQLMRAASLANTRYDAGLSSFAEVLDARRAADMSGERAAAATGRAQRARVVLWQALGGGEFGLGDQPPG